MAKGKRRCGLLCYSVDQMLIAMEALAEVRTNKVRQFLNELLQFEGYESKPLPAERWTSDPSEWSYIFKWPNLPWRLRRRISGVAVGDDRETALARDPLLKRVWDIRWRVLDATR
jgi:hypothetical protein